ncbi:MAG TPA: YcaO-like family protein [Allosphingosinicella sp.]|nr:YcaO-like family protein [Allosphingosinicella sp.]
MPAAAAEGFFKIVAGHGRACGVTRLADITGLDRIGFPVWQAVRPAGKALSVHQGKGASATAAKIGALCEGIESHCAENAQADGPHCRFEDLPERERAPEFADYARRREDVSRPEAVRWCIARELVGGGDIHLPHDLVSLDFTEPGRSWFDRSSAGLGLGADADAATLVSLLELVERDAVGEWQRQPIAARLPSAIDPGSIPYGWFGEWRRRLAARSIDLVAFAPAAVIDVPVAVCWIGGGEAFGPVRRSFSGSACDPDPERALFKAFAEALQSRLTFIAGVRDDILPSHYRERGSPLARALAAAGRPWEDVRPSAPGWRPVADALPVAGYDRIALKRLDEDLDGIAVTKAFVPGLGSLKRKRRVPR